MKILAGLITAVLLFVAPMAFAESLVVEGDFGVSVTGGHTYSGSFRGIIFDAEFFGTRTFATKDFNSFEAELSPALIGETIFNESNLAVLLDFRNSRFEQLWFGGAHLGANGVQEGVDDFFVQWFRETHRRPHSGFFSIASSSSDVSIINGNLRIVLVPEPGGWPLGLFAWIGFLRLESRNRRPYDRCN